MCLGQNGQIMLTGSAVLKIWAANHSGLSFGATLYMFKHNIYKCSHCTVYDRQFHMIWTSAQQICIPVNCDN